MIDYGNYDHSRSGVASYKINDDNIEVAMRSGYHYIYTESWSGKGAVDEMKKLAKLGTGLCRFIQSGRIPTWERKVPTSNKTQFKN